MYNTVNFSLAHIYRNARKMGCEFSILPLFLGIWLPSRIESLANLCWGFGPGSNTASSGTFPVAPSLRHLQEASLHGFTPLFQLTQRCKLPNRCYNSQHARASPQRINTYFNYKKQQSDQSVFSSDRDVIAGSHVVTTQVK